jgi:hypothetical protein
MNLAWSDPLRINPLRTPNVRASSTEGYMPYGICDHPLGNYIEFHPDLAGIPTIRIYLDTTTYLLGAAFCGKPLLHYLFNLTIATQT